MANGFKDLEVWQLAMALANAVFILTKSFPKDEAHGLTNQLRRAAVSVPSNIAEGWGRQSDGSLVHYLKIARGSLNEVHTQLILASDFGYLSGDRLEELEGSINILGRKLFNLGDRLGGRYVREESGIYAAEGDDSIQSIQAIQSIPSP